MGTFRSKFEQLIHTKRSRGGGAPMETPRAEMFRKLLEKDPDNPMILCSLGIELFNEGRYPEAREHLRRAIENNPDSPAPPRLPAPPHWEWRETPEPRR